MRSLKILLASMMLLVACNSESGKTADPDANGRIPQKTLENILYDMQLADVYSLSVRADSTQNFGQKNQDSLARYYNEIFAHYGVKYEQFSKTIEWYKEHPAQFDTVYQNVLNKMSAQDERNKYNIK
jgi:hypothetical protein